ncbi:MAG: hypothetical protein JNM80_03010 [Phycisphaerae bacterium]|nr:hypothetical protein [Phycisphaerae bacterium]
MGAVVVWGQEIGTTPAGNFIAVAGGDDHALALRSDGTLVGWGRNDSGQATVPTGTFKAVSTKFRTSVGLRTDGTIAQWGLNFGGSGAVPLPTASNFVSVSCGEIFGVAIDDQGDLVAWGDPTFGGTNVAWLNATWDPFRAVAAGSKWGIAIGSTGYVHHWGENLYNQANVPNVQVVQIAAGDSHAAAIGQDGQLYVWGNNTYGQWGTSVFPTDRTWQRVFCGAWTTYAIDNNGNVFAAGWSTKGELNVPTGNWAIIQGGWHHVVGVQTTQCYANCDNSLETPTLTAADFVCFSARFAAGDTYANCDNSTTVPILSVNDFYCFANKYAIGCT